VAGLSIFFVYTEVSSVARARAWVAHSHEVIEATQDLFSQVQTAMGAERGYLITQDAHYLPFFDRAEQAIPPLEARLERLVSDSAPQEGNVRALVTTIQRRMRSIDGVMVSARRGDLAGARAMLLGAEGQLSVGDVRADAETIQTVEKDYLGRRAADAERQERLTLAIGLTVSLLALAGLTAGSVIIAGANRRLVKMMADAKAAQTAREASDALSGAIFANSPDYLLVANVEPGEQFVVAEINPAFEEALNVRAEDVRGKNLETLGPPNIAAQIVSHYRRVLAAGRPLTTRDEIKHLPGGPRIWEAIRAPVRGPSGAVDRIIGSIRDITERVQAEQRLREAQRMEAVGQLTGGVAHDFNNLLQVIRGNLELIERAVADDPRASQRLKNALHGADRAAQLTRQLLAFARRQPLAPQVINLARLVSEMADLLRRTLGEAIEVETVVAGGLWNTVADPAQVESALLNLALNARDAMPSGGRLTVEITNASLDDDYARNVEEVIPGQYIMLAVSDTGVGMDEATKARVFEPFFTTKSDGKGTGLGLSMVYGFVKQSNGHIQVYSEPGHGTTVKIYLPRSREAEKPPIRADVAPVDGARQVILVVEDEEAVRAAAVETLRDLGYQPVAAADAESALTLIQGDAQIDLVFTDVVMPGNLKTRDFATRIHELRPQLPILFTSGYTENAIVHHGRLDEGVSLISKPYAKDDLARRLAAMLARQETEAGSV
jgi:PAS domain S-box-containing protein